MSGPNEPKVSRIPRISKTSSHSHIIQQQLNNNNIASSHAKNKKIPARIYRCFQNSLLMLILYASQLSVDTCVYAVSERARRIYTHDFNSVAITCTFDTLWLEMNVRFILIQEKSQRVSNPKVHNHNGYKYKFEFERKCFTRCSSLIQSDLITWCLKICIMLLTTLAGYAHMQTHSEMYTWTSSIRRVGSVWDSTVSVCWLTSSRGYSQHFIDALEKHELVSGSELESMAQTTTKNVTIVQCCAVC